MKGVQFSVEGIRKEYLFYQKRKQNCKGFVLGAEPLRLKLSWVPPSSPTGGTPTYVWDKLSCVTDILVRRKCLRNRVSNLQDLHVNRRSITEKITFPILSLARASNNFLSLSILSISVRMLQDSRCAFTSRSS